MTTQKTIGQLTELTAANTNDVVPIVDNSGQSGVTKRITVENAFKSVPAGQAATPGLAFSGDVDTGISRVGADQLALCTGGQARLTVGATGDITIGSNLIVDGTTTTISSETLLVEDKNIELGTVASPSDATADGGGITLKGATDKTIQWIDSTNAWTFNNKISVQTSVSGSVYAELTTTGSALGLSANLTAGSSASDSVALNFKTSNSGSETTKMRIDPDGKAGIGTEEPSAGLHVVKDVNPVLKLDRGSANTANANLYYNGTLTGQLSAANGNFQISAAGTSTPLTFYTNGSPRLTINSIGNAEFAGQVKADSISGAFQASRSDGAANHVFRGGTSTSNYTSVITANGQLTLSGTSGAFQATRSDGAANHVFRAGTSTSNYTTVITAGGAASFAGGVSVDSYIRSFRTDGDDDCLIARTGSHTSDITARIRANGSAEFAGGLTVRSSSTIDVFRAFSGTTRNVKIQNSGKIELGQVNSAPGIILTGSTGSASFGPQYDRLNVNPGSGSYDGNPTSVVIDGRTNDGNATAFKIDRIDGSGNTSTKFFVNYAGNVGIGTQTVGAAAGDNLTIEDSSNAGITIRSSAIGAGSILFEDTASDRGEIQYSHNGDFMRFKTAGDEAMRITSEGEMYLLGGSSSGSLHFWEGCNVTGNSDTQRLGHGKNGNALIYTNASTPARNVFAIGTSSSVPFVISTNNQERIRVDSSGTLLVGGTSTADNDHANIDSNGTLTIRRATGGGNCIIIKEGATTGLLIEAAGNVYSYNVGSFAFTSWDNESGVNGPYASLGSFGGEARISAGSTGGDDVPLVFRTASSGTLDEQARIDSDGRLLVGTNSNNGTARLQARNTGSTADAGALTLVTTAAAGGDAPNSPYAVTRAVYGNACNSGGTETIRTLASREIAFIKIFYSWPSGSPEWKTGAYDWNGTTVATSWFGESNRGHAFTLGESGGLLTITQSVGVTMNMILEIEYIDSSGLD